MANENKLQDIIAHCKEYGFVFQSSEIYDGLQAVYDYGQNGAELKKNIKDYWWYSMTRLHDNIVGIDSAIFMHPTTWKASGHVDNFNDPMIDNKDSKKRYRVDHLIENHADTLEAADKKALLEKMEKMLADDDFDGLKGLIEELEIKCPVGGTANWTDIRQFNLMFGTQMGSVAGDSDVVYLRPETAQGIFVNFLNVQKTGRMKIPFGIAQIGKAFRNEIVARGFIFRMREFEQMEMQYFVKPGEQMKWYEFWKETRMNWHKTLGVPEDQYNFHDHIKLAHYADAACDIEYNFPDWGFKEVEGIHSRTDFDLSRHQEFSKKKLTYFDTEENKHYVPYVIETSIGLDRTVMMVLSEAYTEEDLSEGDKKDSRVVMKFAPHLAPVKLGIFPLTKKDGLPELAHQIMDECRPHFKCIYEQNNAIGKRYRRQDAIGTPFCITIDHQTKEDGTVTIRHRDSMQQERISMDSVKSFVLDKINQF